ncbi:DEAD/DEAH box helicase [Thermodesulfovibrio yellowstonii]|uniref:DEAD/DEAH box helicase n=1 Tax=Thermodesulfovibrio yellowstonii TaxID=28262 RepID=UPI003C79EAA2
MNKIEILQDTTFSQDGSGTIRYTKNGKLLESKPLACPYPGYRCFNPIQTVFVMNYTGGSCLVMAPTSAGKTLIGVEFCKRNLKSGGNVIYTTPTQALAREIYKTLKQFFSEVYLKLTGHDEEVGLPSSGSIIVTTYEAVQLGLRNKVSWARTVGGIVIDEFHHILASRGDIIEEIVAVGLLRGTPMLCLSATLPEPHKLINWIGVSLFIYSKWRPVPLERVILDDDFYKIVAQYATDNAKTIVFVGTKKIGWSILERLYEQGYRVLNETVPFLKNDSTGDLPFVAFHCADIPWEEQVLIEKKFREASDFNLLIATHTLAYGVNLPADRAVVIVMRINHDGRWTFWPTPIDILQMEGRAGRFGLREKGQSVIVPVSGKPAQRSKMVNSLRGELNDCLSIEFEPFLRKQLLKGDGIEQLLHLFLVPFIYFNDKLKQKAMINKFYSLNNTLKSLYPVIVGDLTRKGYLCDGKLTAKGLFTVKAGLTIRQTEEFFRRASVRMYPVVDASALFKEPFTLENSFVKKADICRVEDMFSRLGVFSKIDDLVFVYSEIGEGERESIKEFLYWINGFFYFLETLHRVPGLVAKSTMEYKSILRGMLTALRLGLVSYSYEELYLTGCSLRSGLPMEYCLLSSIPGISYMRGHALVLALKASKALPPRLKQPVAEYIEKYCETKDFDSALKKALSYRYKDRKDLDREFKKIKEKLQLAKLQGLLFRDKLVESIIEFSEKSFFAEPVETSLLEVSMPT